MKVSLNTIKQLIDFELPSVDELVKKINSQLGGVEEVIDLNDKYKDAKIVRVAECDKHPNADKLSVCKIDAGEGELTTVVCGANNVHKDMWAVWLPPESIVPSTYEEKEQFKLSARELRGVISNGMLASARELGIGDDHEGIVGIEERDIPSGVSLQPGMSFAEVFGLDDTVIDIENKMFTHRPDLFGQLGVAREIACIFGHQFEDPKWYYELQEKPSPTDSFEITTFNEAGQNVPRLMLVGMDNITVGPSPLWLKAKLVALGGKPINNVVDVTNYVMLMTAQPTHAYDYDKLADGTIGARMAKGGEKTTLLNGKTYELTEDDIVIADGKEIIGLGGVMGGFDSEVTSETKRIVLECATFDMYAVRKTGMRYGLFTDAVTRFNKGQSMLMNPYIVQYAVKMFEELAGASVATETYDDLQLDNGEWRAKPAVTPMLGPVEIETEFINTRLGLNLSTDEIIKLLTNVGFECVPKGELLSYWSPAWRMDIQDKEDVVEEVGRLYGFEKLSMELPRRASGVTQINSHCHAKQTIRQSLASSGANEVLTYSFVHEKLIKRAEQDVSQAFKLSNALSPDLQYYRLSVLPSLLDKVHPNTKNGYDEFTLFEIGKGHNKKYHADTDNGMPKEIVFVDAVYTSKKPKSGAAYYRVRRMLDKLASDMGLKLVYRAIAEPQDYPVTAPFDQKRSSFVETVDGVFVGMIGELKQSVIKNFKLPTYTAAMTLDFDSIASAMSNKKYRPIPKYPSVSQDLTLKVPNSVNYQDLADDGNDVLRGLNLGDVDFDIGLVSIFQAENSKDTKSITQRLQIASFEKTLTDQDVHLILEKIANSAKEKFGAEVS